MNKIKIALVLALFAASSAAAQTPAEVNAKFNDAATILNAKKYPEAIAALEKVIAMGLEAGPDALETVQKAQKLLPTLFIRTGAAAAQSGDYDKAFADLSKAEELAELYNVSGVKNQASAMAGKIYMVQGGAAFNSKDYAKAIDVFSKAYAKYPNNTEMSLLLAKSYAESNDMAKATDIYKSIIELGKTHTKYAEPAQQAKDDLTTYLMIAAAAAAKDNNLDSVVKVTENILAVDPDNADANMIRLQTATNMKNNDAVIGFGEAAAEAQKTPEAKSSAYFLLGAAYQNKDNKAKAIEMYKKVVAGDRVDEAKKQIADLSK